MPSIETRLTNSTTNVNGNVLQTKRFKLHTFCVTTATTTTSIEKNFEKKEQPSLHSMQRDDVEFEMGRTKNS